MKKVLSYSLTAVFVFALAFTGCKKYEDGPLFSLASKKSRVVNVWAIEKVLSNGYDVTSDWVALFPDYSVEFKNDNSYILSWTSSLAETGTWDFDSSKENIILTPSNTAAASKWKILRLKSDEAWIEYTSVSGNTMTELHFVTK